MNTEKEVLITKVIDQIKDDFKKHGPESKDSYEEFVRNLLRQVDDSILNEYLDY